MKFIFNRTLTLEEDGIINYAGLEGKKFVSTVKMLDNGTKVPSRKCYCGKECQPSGTLDVSSCKFGAPAFVSLPHFYLADESYRSSLSGLDPNETDHEFYIVIEPVSFYIFTILNLKINKYISKKLFFVSSELECQCKYMLQCK